MIYLDNRPASFHRFNGAMIKERQMKLKTVVACFTLIFMIASCTAPGSVDNSGQPAQNIDAENKSSDSPMDAEPGGRNGVENNADPDAEGDSGWRIIMFCLDGLKFEALNDLIAAGRLPNFQHLIATGASGFLKTDFADSPVTWTTIATGVRCEKHGFCPDDQLKTSFQATTERIKYPRLWEVLPKFGLRAHVANYYFVKQEYPLCNMKDYDDEILEDDKVNPDLMDVLKKHGRPYEAMKVDGGLQVPYRDLSGQMQNVPERFCALKKYSGDLFMSHFQSPDEVGHYEWGFYSLLIDKAKISPELRARAELARDVYGVVYEDFDRRIGEIRRRYPKSLIVVCSDHGMHRVERVALHVIAQPGLFHMMQLPAPGDRNEDVEIPDSKTKYKIIPNSRIIQVQDELNIEVASSVFQFDGPQAKQTAREVYDRIRPLKVNGETVFKMISDKEIGFNQILADKWHELPNLNGNLFLLLMTSGSHDPSDDGVLIFNGPGVKKGFRIEGASVEDVAPTIYAYLGVPRAEDLDGKAHEAAFENAALPGLKEKPVATYGVAPFYRPGDYKRKLDPEEENRLKSLGYIK